MNTVLIAGDVISKNYAKCSCILHLRVLGSGFDQEWIVFAKWNFLNSGSHCPFCPMVSSLGGCIAQWIAFSPHTQRPRGSILSIPKDFFSRCCWPLLSTEWTAQKLINVDRTHLALLDSASQKWWHSLNWQRPRHRGSVVKGDALRASLILFAWKNQSHP